ncbi:MAG: hypothetical protein ABI534_04185 [Chloroflexota bacterium]
MIVHTPTSRSSRFGLPSLGQLGGAPLLAALGSRLDDGHHYLQRVAPAGAAAIDVVLVGPGGTFALTRFDERGRFRHRNGHWYKWNRSTESWAPWVSAPIDDARLAARRLSLYLERAALPSDVRAVVVARRGTMFEPDPEEGHGAAIHGLDDVDALVTRLAGEEVLSAAQVDRIVALLDPRQPLARLAPLAPH